LDQPGRGTDLGWSQADAAREQEKACQLWENLAQANLASPEIRDGLAVGLDNLGGAFLALNRLQDAEQAKRKGIALQEKLTAEFPAVPAYRRDLAEIYRNLSNVLLSAGQTQQALGILRKCTPIAEKLTTEFPAVPDYQKDLAELYRRLGIVFLSAGQTQPALESLRKGIAIEQKLTTQFPGVPSYRKHLAMIYGGLSSVLLSAGQTSEALAIKEKELSTWEQLAASHPTVADFRTGLASCRLTFVDLLQKSGRTREAEQVSQRLPAELSTAIQLDPTNAHLWARRAGVYAHFGQWDKALPDYVRSTELDPSNHWFWYFRSALQLHLGDVDGYRRSCREMLKCFGSTDDLDIAVRTAMTCSLSPDAVSDFDPVLKLAGLAVEKNSSYPWAIFAKGLAEYRARHYAVAVDWLKRVPPNATAQFPWYLSATGSAVLAMARHQLSQTEEARTALGQARSILAEKMPKLEKGERFDFYLWHDWLRAQILYREAEALIGIGNRNTQHKDTKDRKKKP
jgi:tetratricopeptide (TPR) repeat protein